MEEEYLPKKQLDVEEVFQISYEEDPELELEQEEGYEFGAIDEQ